jgi:hypothetical protein
MTTIPLKLISAAAMLMCSLAAGVWAAGGSGAVRPIAPTEAAAPAPPAAPAHPVCDLMQRDRSLNKLKQIMIAIHAYHDVNNNFPQDVADKDGKPLLSWRVLLLPYLEQDQLYKQFKLDEPWDSANNKKLLAQMPGVYRVGIEPKDSTKTHYQGFAGPKSMFEPGKKLSFRDVTDGLSNTLCVVEAGPPVEWTKPADIPYDSEKPMPKLEGPFRNTLNCVVADGSAYSFKRDIDEKTLHGLIERDDGMVTQVPKDLEARFPLTKKDITGARKALEQSEKTMEKIAGQLREQQKLLAQIGEKQDPANPIMGIDIQRISRMQEQLELTLQLLEHETEKLRKEVEAAKKK